MANPHRKHRGDSKLKTLPDALQADIIAKLKAGKGEAVIAWLKEEWDVATSEGALSAFWSWWHLRQRMEHAERMAVDHRQWLETNTDLSPEAVMEAGQLVFMSQASGDNNPKLFEAMAKLLLRSRKQKANENFTREKLDLEARRIAVLEAKAAKAEEILKEDAATPADKEARLKQVFGIA